jgi:hypothetical protein
MAITMVMARSPCASLAARWIWFMMYSEFSVDAYNPTLLQARIRNKHHV